MARADSYADDPYRSYRFAIEIDGITDAYFTEVSGLEASYDVIEFRAGSMPNSASIKMPGLYKNPVAVFKQGMTANMELHDWFKGEAVAQGAVERFDITVKALDTDGATELAVWVLYDAWPSKYQVSGFNAKESAVAIETLEFAYETMERTS